MPNSIFCRHHICPWVAHAQGEIFENILSKNIFKANLPDNIAFNSSLFFLARTPINKRIYIQSLVTSKIYIRNSTRPYCFDNNSSYQLQVRIHGYNNIRIHLVSSHSYDYTLRCHVRTRWCLKHTWKPSLRVLPWKPKTKKCRIYNTPLSSHPPVPGL